MFKKCRLFLVAFLVSLFLPMLPSAYANHDDFVVAGVETGGSMRGPLFHVYGIDGAFRVGEFVLNPNFTNYDIIGDVLNGDPPGTSGVTHERILVCGVETLGSMRGPAIQLYNRDTGALVFSTFVLSTSFDANTFECEIADIDGDDGIEEIIVTGQETGGSARGWAIQVYDQTGAFLRGTFTLGNNVTDVFFDLHDDDGF